MYMVRVIWNYNSWNSVYMVKGYMGLQWLKQGVYNDGSIVLERLEQRIV